MSIFPTKILLAPDGSEEAELALLTAVDLANRTNSELQVVHIARPGQEATMNPTFALNRELWEETLREVEREARELLDSQVKKIEEAGEESQMLTSGSLRPTSSPQDGQRLRFGGSPRPLPRAGREEGQRLAPQPRRLGLNRSLLDVFGWEKVVG
jgi:nucleotide-binding universal stress UspA family protein